MKLLLIGFLCLLMGLTACEKEVTQVKIEKLYNKTFKAKLLSQAANQHSPIVVFVSGSSGGFFKDEYLIGLVEKGFDVVSLAYFGVKGLPERLERIPLEYIEACIRYVRSQLDGDRRGVVLMGPSRGAELSLLYASNFDNLDAVVAYAPSCLVLPEAIYNRDAQSLKSSWTKADQEIPFAPQPVLPRGGGTIDYHQYISPFLRDATVFSQARIPVEKIKCPVLLMSGVEDGVWPAKEMCDSILAVAGRNGTSSLFKNYSYLNAGHQFLFFGDELPKKISSVQTVRLDFWEPTYKFYFGGTQKGNFQAMLESQEAVIRFLKNLEDSH